MAKIEIVVIGTHGEVRPLLALGVALRDAGHDVILCAPPNEEKWIQSYGFKFYSAGCDVYQLINGLNKYMGHPIELLKAVKATLENIICGQFELVKEASEGVDLIIGGGEPFAAPSIAKYLNVPYIFVNLVTQFMPSNHYPPTVIPWQNMPRFMNTIAWKLVNSLINLSLIKKINENRIKLGLDKIKDFYDYFLNNMALCIIAICPYLDVSPKYKFKYIQTGLWQIPEVKEEELEPGLEVFLKSGPPPVYFGFGSMSDSNPKETIKIINETIKTLKIRALVSKGWAELSEDFDFKDVYMVGFVEHSKLFPRVSCVVHHGGPGTVYTAAHAGVPQVIVPHMLDHYYQGDLLYKKKLTPKAINRSKLTSKKLTRAIHEAITNQEYIENNKRLGIQLRKVDQECIKKAVESVNKVLKDKGLS
ncbi:glycosyltransferase [Lachnotalea glycerini]|uniref:Glycosyltransferase n=1 Tax=Lachnotalea glycerini TaxID=1763509 RepID=A0A371JJJ9_9FIRM|nr:glycosyltransferase [Lachnotalea glycerini]RDY32913.1 glycosyltransferase [Lachnotalea glycerini]